IFKTCRRRISHSVRDASGCAKAAAHPAPSARRTVAALRGHGPAGARVFGATRHAPSGGTAEMA
ncbi:hypothetical protein ACFL5O_08500, partial [Myxococcota bacterium]